ncbi:MAG: hypothetical protein M1497_15945 [Nitrospirae bacterium]|nr:hypothetical protein [Nitrospirota bacterium]
MKTALKVIEGTAVPGHEKGKTLLPNEAINEINEKVGIVRAYTDLISAVEDTSRLDKQTLEWVMAEARNHLDRVYVLVNGMEPA